MNEEDRKERKRHPLLKHNPAGYDDLKSLSKGIMEDEKEYSKTEKVDKYLKSLIRKELAILRGDIESCECNTDHERAFELLDEGTQNLVRNGKINIPSLLAWCSKINAAAKGKFEG